MGWPAVRPSSRPTCFLLLPLILGLIGALKGSVSSFAVLAVSDVQLKQSQIVAGLAESLLLPLAAGGHSSVLSCDRRRPAGLRLRRRVADGRSSQGGCHPSLAKESSMPRRNVLCLLLMTVVSLACYGQVRQSLRPLVGQRAR